MLAGRYKVSKLANMIKSILETQIWLMLVSKTERLERSFAGKLRAHFTRIQKDILKQLKEKGTFEYDFFKWENDLIKLFEEEIPKAVKIGYDRANDEIEKLGKDYDDILKMVISEYQLLVKNINLTTQNKLKQVLKEGIINGLSIQEISAEIVKKINHFKSARARTIARTEVARFSNWAYRYQMDDAGYVYKKFVTALDEQVCPICSKMNGMIVKMNDTFETTIENSGKTYHYAVDIPPLHPNCRCTVVAVKEKGESPKLDVDMDEIQLYIDALGEENVEKMMEYLDRDDLWELKRFHKNLESFLKESVKRAKVIKITHLETVEKIIDSKEIQNQYFTFTSSGLLDEVERTNFENVLYGYDRYGTRRLHPKYATWYWGNLFDTKNDSFEEAFDKWAKADNLKQYGDVGIEFKDSIKKRTTFTFHDSLNLVPNLGIPFSNKPKWYAFPNYAIKYISYEDEELVKKLIRGKVGFDELKDFIVNNTPYFEAQIHGKVTIRDIAKIWIPKKYKRRKLTKRMIEKLEKIGIPYEFY